MIISDYIQLTIAVVAGIAAILTGLNIFFTNQQVNLQRKQWESSYVPIFRISLIKLYSGNITLVIENTNAVYHEIQDITFSSEDVKVKEFYDGTVENYRDVYKGLIVMLYPKTREYQIGSLQITGIDALGNEFKVNSKDIKFKYHRIENDKFLIRTYLKKIESEPAN
ncbi:hypothetical protein B0H99_101392 [Planomicrobium soli]|uniref:Uncharacterized protein n=1 Tax=Planomicrobium soli TaxID=1176648 RepID=A0A2P8H7I1_9BACL|nr:hypothetical protein [Planomicrobium soli]PSL42144.1 hypothetical protein B0H99_101392 [Planomicrobium soli]